MTQQSISTDIDIDFADRNTALSNLIHITASIVHASGAETRHPSGVYFQDIPVNPITDNSAFPYTEAPNLGYFKIDFLNNSLYEEIRDESHLVDLMREPDWSLLEDPDIVSLLAHIRGHFGTVQAIAPKSVEDLALVLALIRPGKQKLLGLPREEMLKEIWSTSTEGYSFKKSHGIAYAVSIVVQMNLLVEQMIKEMANGVEDIG